MPIPRRGTRTTIFGLGARLHRQPLQGLPVVFVAIVQKDWRIHVPPSPRHVGHQRLARPRQIAVATARLFFSSREHMVKFNDLRSNQRAAKMSTAEDSAPASLVPASAFRHVHQRLNICQARGQILGQSASAFCASPGGPERNAFSGRPAPAASAGVRKFNVPHCRRRLPAWPTIQRLVLVQASDEQTGEIINSSWRNGGRGTPRHQRCPCQMIGPAPVATTPGTGLHRADCEKKKNAANEIPSKNNRRPTPEENAPGKTGCNTVSPGLLGFRPTSQLRAQFKHHGSWPRRKIPVPRPSAQRMYPSRGGG